MMRSRTRRALLPALCSLLITAAALSAQSHAAASTTRPDWAMWIGLLIAAAAITAVVRSVFRSLRTPAEHEAHSGPFIVFPIPPPGARDAEPTTSEPPSLVPTMPPPAAPAGAAARAPTATPAPAPPHIFEGQTIRFYVPTDGTLQLLPGRLEVVGGTDRGQEIRFVRADEGPQEITFGRSDGPPHRHIQLRAATVSRAHARMLFADGTWTIYNLSRTNPVVLNGEELDGSDAGVALSDGDRIEMGEVIFTYRER